MMGEERTRPAGGVGRSPRHLNSQSHAPPQGAVWPCLHAATHGPLPFRANTNTRKQFNSTTRDAQRQTPAGGPRRRRPVVIVRPGELCAQARCSPASPPSQWAQCGAATMPVRRQWAGHCGLLPQRGVVCSALSASVCMRVRTRATLRAGHGGAAVLSMKSATLWPRARSSGAAAGAGGVGVRRRRESRKPWAMACPREPARSSL